MHRIVSPVAVLAAALLAGCGTAAAPPAAIAPQPLHLPRVITGVPFEGQITLEVARGQGPAPVTVRYEIKGTAVRYESIGGAAPQTTYAVADLADGTAHAISDELREYVDVPALPQRARPRGPSARFWPTGSTEVVGGYQCEDWQMIADGQTIDACVIKTVPFVDLVRWPPQTEPPVWAAELTRRTAFPLKLVVRDRSGDQRLRLEASAIEEILVSPSRFGLPAGYRKIALAKDAVLFGID